MLISWKAAFEPSPGAQMSPALILYCRTSVVYRSRSAIRGRQTLIPLLTRASHDQRTIRELSTIAVNPAVDLEP